MKCEYLYFQDLKLKVEKAGDIDSMRVVNSDYKLMLNKIELWRQQCFCGSGDENYKEKKL